MPNLRHKKILLGVTGSIAAYKVASLVRLLVKNEAEVRVLMTHSASTFISPLTLQTLSKHEVFTDISDEHSWNNHVELGLWADLMIVAPATANTLAKMANGICDNILMATFLSAKCPVWVAPAMDLDMWKHPSTRRNLNLLDSDGIRLIPVGVGELASGLYGEGRMAEPEEIVGLIDSHFESGALPLEGKHVLVTGGPTHEAIDPVRFIGNRSSGKMALGLCTILKEYGAKVHLVLGPVANPSIFEGYYDTLKLVVSADEMYEASLERYAQVDAAIFSAAVADFKVANPSGEKIKKQKDSPGMDLKLIPNPDIAQSLGRIKRDGVFHIGFALETARDGVVFAKEKLLKKNFDLVVLNYLSDQSGFEVSTNQITLIDRHDFVQTIPLMEKKEAARHIIDRLVSFF